jgi:very-short-patch-repair endonuclease
MSIDRQTMLARAARMRREPTEAERRLWWRIRDAQLGGHKFRRQATIGNRIVDYFCPAKGLIIELDGDTHDRRRDALRDVNLQEQHGFHVLRFANSQVMENLDGVLEAMLSTRAILPDRWNRRTTPSPSSKEEGRQL